jgi:Domain of unknown function DUF29
MIELKTPCRTSRSYRAISTLRRLTSRAGCVGWEFRPEERFDRRSHTIEGRRDRIAPIVEDSPGLGSRSGEVLARESRKPRRTALPDTKPLQARIPTDRPSAVAEVLDPDFLPHADER